MFFKSVNNLQSCHKSSTQLRHRELYRAIATFLNFHVSHGSATRFLRNGRISRSIFTKIGTDVKKTRKVKTSSLGVNIAPHLPTLCPPPKKKPKRCVNGGYKSKYPTNKMSYDLPPVYQQDPHIRPQSRVQHSVKLSAAVTLFIE